MLLNIQKKLFLLPKRSKTHKDAQFWKNKDKNSKLKSQNFLLLKCPP